MLNVSLLAGSIKIARIKNLDDSLRFCLEKTQFAVFVAMYFDMHERQQNANRKFFPSLVIPEN